MRCADVAPLGGQHVELEAGGRGAQGEAYAGGLGLDEVELRVVGLGARPRGQAVRQQATTTGTVWVTVSSESAALTTTV